MFLIEFTIMNTLKITNEIVTDSNILIKKT